MSNIKLNIGDKVCYCPEHGEKENGIIKGFATNGNPFVVYNCGGDWENYIDYTAANTPKEMIKKQWDKGARNSHL